ncbi:MAG TPA: invasion associated locus B family protein [Rhizomicrobium sp.]|nr:invasion associated locus B family protein [Rhizomicrobium sp.]
MKSMRKFSAALAAFALVVTPVLAQDAPQQQQPAKRQGPQVIKTFGGWDVRCFPVSTPAPCDVWEAIAFKQGGQLAVSVSVVYVPSQDRHLMQFIVPLGVDFAKGAKLVAGTYTSEMIPFHHCDRIGCYFGVGNANAVVDAIRSQNSLKVRIAQFRGKSADLNVPTKGFEEAHAMMVEQAKQKAGKPAAAPAAEAPAAPDNSTNP